MAQNPRSAIRASILSPRHSDCAKTHSEQQAAITILLDQHDDNIFAYLRFARSLHHNFRYSPGHGSLSREQVLAVCTLRDCTDDEIRTQLDLARKLGENIGHVWSCKSLRGPASDSEQANYPWGDSLQQEPGFAYLSSSGLVGEVLHAPCDGASVCAPPSVIQFQDSCQSTLNTSGVYPQQTLDKTNTSHEAIKTANLYWCTICEDRHSYKNVSDWRKHEKEHVETYVCMLWGPLEENEDDSKCTLCGISNPSQKHFDAHSIQTCGQGAPGSFSCKRRTDLVRHLKKCHDVQGKAQGEAIADKWKETIKKRAWSCGFCICLVNTFGDRLKHIAAHFERGQTLDEWDTTKVIEGLLLQPGMISAWEAQLAASSMSWEPSSTMWKKHSVKGLQHDLEVGPSDTKHAAALAKEAHEARQSNRHLLDGEKPRSFARIHGALETSVSVPRSDYDSIPERAFEPNSSQDLSRFVANPTNTPHYGAAAWDGVPMATYNCSTFPASFSDDGSSSVQAPWLSDPGQTWTFGADQFIDSDWYQEHGNATTGGDVWPTRPSFSDEPDTDNMLD